MGKTIYDPKTDPRFQNPVIDQDEWRERYLADGVTIPAQGYAVREEAAK